MTTPLHGRAPKQNARICCLIGSLDLSELKLSLVRGQTVVVDADQARSSSQLTEALRIGAVSVRYEAKCQYEVQAPPQRTPPWLQKGEGQIGAMTQPPRAREHQTVASGTPELSSEQLQEIECRIRRSLEKEFEEKIRGLREELLENQIEVHHPKQRSEVRTEVTKESDSHLDDEMPLFIPSGIVDSRRVKVVSEESSSKELDKARGTLSGLRESREERD